MSKPYWKLLKERINSNESDIQSLNQLDSILHRPNVVIGSHKEVIVADYVFDQTKGKISSNVFSFIEGLYKLFDEAFTNACDHVIRMSSCQKGQPVTYIKVNIADDTISIINDGKGIRHGFITDSNGKQIRTIEACFTNLNTSSNYKDKDERTTGGMNGLGIKCTSIFSRYLIIESVTNGELYRQLIENNNTIVHEPQIIKVSHPDYVSVTFKPDLEYFGVKTFNSMIPLFMRRVLDAACLFEDVKVYLNNNLAPIRGLKEYTSLFLDDNSFADKDILIIEHKIKRYQLAVFPSSVDGHYIRFSLINGLAVKEGNHFQYAIDQLSERILIRCKAIKKNIISYLTPNRIKNCLSLILILYIDKPIFTSQTKNKLAMSRDELIDFIDFLKGINDSMIDSFLKKSSFIERLEMIIMRDKEKESKKILKKTDGKKSRFVGYIDGYHSANEAGGRLSNKCSLFLAEGKSAIGYIVEARKVFGKAGADYLGVYALNGKMINPKQSSVEVINKNVAFKNLKKILGLNQNEKYETIENLNYGSLIIVSDADIDGIHITSLIINLLTHYWPAFLKNGFIKKLNTPCIKAYLKSGKIEDFVSVAHFNQWIQKNSDVAIKNIRYFKGLASNDLHDFEDIFNNINKNLVQFVYDDKSVESLKLAFSSDTEPRKKWLTNQVFDANSEVIFDKQILSFSEFIHDHYKLFGLTSLSRAIPHIMDGFKVAQRKVIYTMLRNSKFKRPTKMLIAGSKVIEKALYVHGDQSLHETMVHLAQNFVGTNNINLLQPLGFFGSRYYGTSKFGCPRYLNIAVHPIAETIFHPEDDAILKYVSEENEVVEPIHYVGVVPMVLINGAQGIAVGFSTRIPKYHPLSITRYIREYLDGKPLTSPTIFYHGSKCRIEETETKVIFTAKYHTEYPNKIIVNDLPPTRTIESFKKHIEILEECGVVTKFEKNFEEPVLGSGKKKSHEPVNWQFEITVSDDYLSGKIKTVKKKSEDGKSLITIEKCETAELVTIDKIEKDFVLKSTISKENMYLFNSQNAITKYPSVKAILNEFIETRMKYYEIRKAHLIDSLNKDYELISCKYFFVKAIVDGKLEVRQRKRSDIEADLIANWPEIKKLNGYDYLFALKINHLTKEKLDQLKQELDNIVMLLEEMKKKKIKDMYLEDLNAFENSYRTYF